MRDPQCKGQLSKAAVAWALSRGKVGLAPSGCAHPFQVLQTPSSPKGHTQPVTPPVANGLCVCPPWCGEDCQAHRTRNLTPHPYSSSAGEFKTISFQFISWVPRAGPRILGTLVQLEKGAPLGCQTSPQNMASGLSSHSSAPKVPFLVPLSTKATNAPRTEAPCPGFPSWSCHCSMVNSEKSQPDADLG